MTPSAAFDENLVRRYDRPGPRYTSYPTALQFTPAFGPDELLAAAHASNAGTPPKPLSIYVHVPFCASPCFYCGCNKVITRDVRKGAEYLARLGREIELVGSAFSRRRPVQQLHLGGGTPTFLSIEQIAGLLTMLERTFSLSRDESREFSIEIDPRTVDRAAVAQLAALGFNRVSLGIQDFDPAVQAAVNRVQTPEHTFGLVRAARAAGIRSVSVDLIYGLPMQTATSFVNTLEVVADARPDRVAVYSYAHLPHLFKPQKQIRARDLPSPAEKLALLGFTVTHLTAAGYVYVGMDHFALPEDDLVKAQRDGSLHRNFQGYSTQADCDLVGLGVSSISKIGDTYAQNAKALGRYYAAIDADALATDRGIRLTAEDALRRDVIQALMCGSCLDFAAIGADHGIDFRSHFAPELTQLAPFMADRLVTCTDHSLQVTDRGRLLTRNIAMVFDPYLRTGSADSVQPRYSRAV